MESIELINWQELHLLEDEASAKDTCFVRCLVQQVQKAQKNPFLKPIVKPIVNNLMMAHALRIHNYEPPAQIPPPQEVPNAGAARVFHEENGELILKMRVPQEVLAHHQGIHDNPWNVKMTLLLACTTIIERSKKGSKDNLPPAKLLLLLQ